MTVCTPVLCLIQGCELLLLVREAARFTTASICSYLQKAKPAELLPMLCCAAESLAPGRAAVGQPAAHTALKQGHH